MDERTEKVNAEGLNAKAALIIKLMPDVKSVKLTRMGADISAFIGSGAVYSKKLKLHAAGKRIKARFYYPKEGKPQDCLIYFHGGGFMYGGLGTADGGLRDYCDRTKQAVLSVAYSLAPEHPYPRALNECFDVSRGVYRRLRELGLNRVFLGGDSAGGNLACVTASRLISEGYKVAGLMLLYPFAELCSEGIEQKYPSMEKFKEGYFLTADALKNMTRSYVSDNYDVTVPTLSPINGDLSKYPPTIIFVCGFDPLRDMGIKLHEKLMDSGVHTRLVCYNDIIHGYFSMFKDYADDTVEKTAEFFANLN